MIRSTALCVQEPARGFCSIWENRLKLYPNISIILENSFSAINWSQTIIFGVPKSARHELLVCRVRDMILDKTPVILRGRVLIDSKNTSDWEVTRVTFFSSESSVIQGLLESICVMFDCFSHPRDLCDSQWHSRTHSVRIKPSRD